ncbi:MAG: hypothetical protein ACPGSC_11700, partial [Granulosicoccaceae bacterium]
YALEEIELTLQINARPSPAFPNPQRLAEILQRDLESIGLGLKINFHDDLHSLVETLQKGEMQIAIVNWQSERPLSRPDDFLVPLLSCQVTGERA